LSELPVADARALGKGARRVERRVEAAKLGADAVGPQFDGVVAAIEGLALELQDRVPGELAHPTVEDQAVVGAQHSRRRKDTRTIDVGQAGKAQPVHHFMEEYAKQIELPKLGRVHRVVPVDAGREVHLDEQFGLCPVGVVPRGDAGERCSGLEGGCG
jgi:hypothetical protein